MTRATVDGGWYTVDLVETRVENGELVVTLDETTITVNRRDWRYWLAMVRVAAVWFRHGFRWPA